MSVEIDASELNDVIDDLEMIVNNAERKSPQLQSDLAEDMMFDIEVSIAKTFKNWGPDDKEQVQLNRSFSKMDLGQKTRIYSSAPHAYPLETGVGRHRIRPDKAGAISFIPENPASYPDHLKGEGAYEDTVTINPKMPNHPDGVMWEPDKNPQGWDYVYKAQQEWAGDSSTKTTINDAVKEMISQTRFSRDG